MEDEATDPIPPTAERVARRAIVLSVISCRGIFDDNQENREENENLMKNAQDWLSALVLEDEMSAWERLILETPLGKLADRVRVDASWLSEAMTVLAWSLGKFELPDYDEQCDPAEVANRLGFLEPVENTALSHSVMRAPSLLEEYNEFIYNVHWRVRDFSINRRSYDFESLARKAWGEPVLRHGLKLEEGDMCVGGVAMLQASEKGWRTLSSITRERHLASNWLIGYASEDFYEVTTDT